MLDDDDAVAAVHQPVQHADEFVYVGHVQAHGGFVQHVQGVRCLLAAPGDVVAHFGQLGHEFDALGFATAQRGTGLAQREVAQAHVLQQLQRVGNGGHAGKKAHGLIDFHAQHVANAFAAPAHGQRFGVEARAVADLAGHFHIGQKAHGDGAYARALAAGAAALAGVEGKAPGAVAARLGLQRVGKQLAHGVPEADVGGRAAARRFANGRLIDFEHAVNAFKALQAGAADQRRRLARIHGLAPGLGGALAHPGGHVGQQHIARQRGFARAAHAGNRHQTVQGHLHGHIVQVVQMGAVQREPAHGGARLGLGQSIGGQRCRLCGALFGGGALAPGRGSGRLGEGCGRLGQRGRCLGLRAHGSAGLAGHHAAPRLQRVAHGMQQVAARLRVGCGGDVGHAALGHQPPAALARAGANVDDVVGTADGVLVVLHHHQRVALGAQLVQRVEQDVVVARVQADGGLVQHIAHALQVAAQLRGQADALRFTATQGGRAPVQRQVAQAHFFEEGQAAFDLGDQVAGDVGFARAQAALGLQCLHPAAQVADGQPCQLGDGHAIHGSIFCMILASSACGLCASSYQFCKLRAKAHGPRGGVEPGACAAGADHIAHVGRVGLGKGLLAAFLFVGQHRVVQHLALRGRELHAGAHAVGAPAVLAVVGEKARVEFGVAGGADRAGAPCREHLQAAYACRGRTRCHGVLQAVEAGQHMHHALAVLQGAGQGGAQIGFVVGRHGQAHHRQLDGVLLEAVDARKTRGRQKVSIHAQVAVAARARPVGQFGIDALARHHQRRQQADVLAPKLREQLRGDALCRLWLHGGAVFGAVLHAQLDVQQPQKVPHLGGGAHSGLAPAPAQALLNGHRGRNAIHGIHLGPPGRLHDAARVGVEAFQVAALALVEQNVKRQRGFARAAHARDHAELAARNVHAQVAQVVLFGVDDLYGVFGL